MIIPEDNAMLSFDVNSLYTSIPLQFAKTCVRDAVENDPSIKIRTSLTNDELMKLVSLCLDSCTFQYNDAIYRQIHGCPMGFPKSVVVAELTMQRIEKNIFESSPCTI